MTAVWHENPTCLDHIICGRGTPQEQSLTSDPLSPINSWLAFVRDEHFSSQTFDAASNNVESEGTIDTAIATGLKLQDGSRIICHPNTCISLYISILYALYGGIGT